MRLSRLRVNYLLPRAVEEKRLSSDMTVFPTVLSDF
jgi:hypothetical protein